MEVSAALTYRKKRQMYFALKSEEQWPVEWDDLLKKTEVKLLERTYYSPLTLVLNCFAVYLGKGDVVHVQALPFQGL